ncbi:MAG: hypothetical protein ACXWDM_08510, partial [Nocardioides sp.]
LSTDGAKSLIGLPATGLPLPMSGSISTPEFALYKSEKQFGIAKIALFAFDHGCDCDHAVPYRDDGGTHQTCSCSLAPLCRTHHRHKTHGAWTYTILEPGSYLWSSPHGDQYLRDHTGTLDVTPSRRPPVSRPLRD